MPISIFHPTFLILVTGVSNAFIAGDLFNLFVSFEILLTASYVLLTSGGTKERLRAGAPYIVVSLLSSLIFLSAIAMIYAATGTVNLADLSVKLADAAGRASWPCCRRMLLVAFGVKAAVFPMSAWLPDSYPSAPAPVTAVFAGLLTKVGIYAIIRVQTLLFPTGSYGTLLMIAALLTMVVGILGAVSQSGHQTDAVVHPGLAHRLHAVRRRAGLARPGSARRSTTWRTTSWCRRRCSWRSV